MSDSKQTQSGECSDTDKPSLVKGVPLINNKAQPASNKHSYYLQRVQVLQDSNICMYGTQIGRIVGTPSRPNNIDIITI